jgi:hypothetical protein
MPPTVNSYIPPIIGEVISSCIVIFFNYIFKTARVILVSFKLHPAVILKSINLIFSNIELPLSSKISHNSGVPVIIPNDAAVIGYSARPSPRTVNKGQTNELIFINNFIIFMLVNSVANLVNAVASTVIFLTLPINVELIAQVITTVSIFFIAFPVGLAGSWALFTYGTYLTSRSDSNFAENLAAVQQGLYVSEPLLLLVSITGLLVALIGAPFFIKGN